MRRAATWSSVPLTGGTIPHEVVGQHGAGKVLMKPAAPGAGVIAGGAVRAIMECAGITDILTKSLGSTNPHNMVRAAMDGLQQLTTVEQIARERGVEAVRAARYRSRAKVEGGGIMARTFVWHPSAGARRRRARTSRRRARCGSSRCAAASGIRGACAGRSRRSGLAPPGRGDQAGSRRAARTDQARAPPRRGDARSREVTKAVRRSGEAKIGLHNLSPAPGSHREPQASRPRSGLRHRQDVGQGPQGYQGARGPSRPGRRQAAVRGRPDAAHAPRCRSVASRIRSAWNPGRSSRRSRAARRGEVTRESLREAGSDRRAKGPVKVLANGEITQAVTVRGLKVSAGAREKIVAAGGRVEE